MEKTGFTSERKPLKNKSNQNTTKSYEIIEKAVALYYTILSLFILPKGAV